MVNLEKRAITEHFSNITDKRRYNKRHKLIDIIIITIVSVIAGANTWEQIEEYAVSKKSWFKTFLELPHGIPSHDTIARVFAVIATDEFKESFLSWIQSVALITKGQVIAIDGKTLRGSYDKSSSKAAIHMVSAWGTANGIVLGQVKTAEKSNEITAIPELINMLDISGCIVTIDAMGCQKKIAKQIVEQDGDYVFSLKENHKHLHDDVELFFQENVKTGFKGVEYDFYETVDGGHGRVEIRRYWTTGCIGWLYGKEKWANLQIIGMAERERHIGNSISRETSYFIGSIESKAKMLANAVRGHWGIENKLHWVLDVTFREDESRIRKDNAPANFAILRHMALNILKSEKSSRMSIRTKRLKAGWDDNYMAKLLKAGT